MADMPPPHSTLRLAALFPDGSFGILPIHSETLDQVRRKLRARNAGLADPGLHAKLAYVHVTVYEVVDDADAAVAPPGDADG
jgi:hypothetical protein